MINKNRQNNDKNKNKKCVALFFFQSFSNKLSFKTNKVFFRVVCVCLKDFHLSRASVAVVACFALSE
jgi:hypothetical protein